MDITNDQTKSMGEKVDVCSEQENNHGSEILWKASLPSQDHSVTQDSEETLPPPQTLTSKTLPPIPECLPATPALGSLSDHTTLHLDLSSPLQAADLNAPKSQVEPMNPLCRQAMVSPTGIKSLEEESETHISHFEEKLMPRMSHRLSSGLLKGHIKDSASVSPGKNVEITQLVAQFNIGPNPIDPGTDFLNFTCDLYGT